MLARHGLVLKDPAPQVYLEEYGDSAIVFSLTYWTVMTLESDSRRVKSDLLHMIDRAFAEAGIAMPFPQRDVHLDASAPLKVEVVAGAAGPGAARLGRGRPSPAAYGFGNCAAARSRARSARSADSAVFAARASASEPPPLTATRCRYSRDQTTLGIAVLAVDR